MAACADVVTADGATTTLQPPSSQQAGRSPPALPEALEFALDARKFSSKASSLLDRWSYGGTYRLVLLQCT